MGCATVHVPLTKQQATVPPVQPAVAQKVPLPLNVPDWVVHADWATSEHVAEAPVPTQQAPSVDFGHTPAPQDVQGPSKPPPELAHVFAVVMEQVPPLQQAPSTSTMPQPLSHVDSPPR